MKWQVILLVFLVLASAALVALKFSFGQPGEPANVEPRSQVKTAVSDLESELNKTPERDWKILDPTVSSQAIIVQSLDDNFPFYRFGTSKSWPMASLTKLLTAVITLENVGLDKKIAVTPDAMATEGEAGDLREGEIYTARDLLKIMLMMSSNRAAAALEYSVGHDQFVKMMMDKARSLNMTQTTVYDASGLNDGNVSTASDVFTLLKYILEHDPEILNDTRLSSLTVQPVNSDRSHTITNIDPLSSRTDFLGGKTGTSDVAKQNLAAILSFRNRRLAVVILGSPDRFKETDNLLNWIGKAYGF
ncbi:MAG: serine hydrolase [Minisyncoccia bacterium]|jgi:D-alanyl-D-alanine carboxypeptidase